MVASSKYDAFFTNIRLCVLAFVALLPSAQRQRNKNPRVSSSLLSETKNCSLEGKVHQSDHHHVAILGCRRIVV